MEGSEVLKGMNKNELDTLTKEVSRSERLEIENERLKAEVENLKAEVEKLKAEVEKLRSKK